MANVIFPRLSMCLLHLCFIYSVQIIFIDAQRTNESFVEPRSSKLSIVEPSSKLSFVEPSSKLSIVEPSSKLSIVEPSSSRVKRQNYQEVSPNSWSAQDLIRDSGVSIWGPSNYGYPSGQGSGSGSWSDSGSGSGYGFGSGFGFGSQYGPGSYNSEESGEVDYESYSHNENECPFPFTAIGNSCYYAICGSGAITWKAAMQFCKNYSSQLAVFADANQYVDALNYIRYSDPQGNCSYWIGGYSVNSVFQWTTGALMPVGTPFWGFNSPSNPTVNNYTILNKNDFYRIDNIADSNSNRGTYVTLPLCQYVPGNNSGNGNYGNGVSSGGGSGSGSGGSGGSTTNTVINQSSGSSYRSVQNITQINTPTLNITVLDDFNISSPINITVYPPQITYTYLEPKQYGSDGYGLYNYLASTHNYSPKPSYQQGAPMLVRTHGKTKESTPKKTPLQAKAEISYPDLYVRILNTMKLLMAKIEETHKGS